MKDEGLITGDRIHALAARSRPVRGRLVLFEVRNVMPGPLILLFIPPDEFLALTPRPAIRPSRAAVVQNANIIWPGISPAMPQGIVGLALIGLVEMLLRIYAGVDPAAG